MSRLPPETRLWDLLRGALGTRALAIASDLRVCEAIGAGPRPVADIASEVGADPDTLHRLLRALASDGVFVEQEAGTFANNDASELLRGGGWGEFAHLFGGLWYRAAEGLGPGTGPTFPDIFGTDFWSWLGHHPDERAAFDRAMIEGVQRRADRLLALDWRGDETVVDIGGGNGSLLVELIGRRPGLRGIVLDLPETDRDETALGRLEIRFVPGSFFEGVPRGDVYVLGTVLHNWDDEDALRILRTLREHAPRHARVLIVDAVVRPGNEPQGAKWLDLLLLVLLGGRERDDAQWRALLERAGLAIERIDDGLIEARCP